MNKQTINEKLNDAIKACYSDDSSNVIQSIQVLSKLLMEVEIDERHVSNILERIILAITKNDFIMAGDYLYYQLKPALNDIKFENILFWDYDQDIPIISEKIFYMTTETDELALCIKDDCGNTVRLNSIISPINEVSKWAENYNFKRLQSVVCLFGIGTGLFAEEILKRITTDSTLIIFEPNKSIIDYCSNSGLSSDCDEAEKRIFERIRKIINDKRVVLYIESEDPSGFVSILSDNIEYLKLAGLIVAKHNNYDKLYPESCRKFIREIDYFRRRMMLNKGTVSIFKEDTVDNTFNNIKIAKEMNMCSDIGKILPKDIPVIIVSAGPSLQKNVDILKEAKGHSLIIAVDRALNFLLERNIIPDITISIDALKPLECYADRRVDDIPAIFDIIVNKEIINKHKGRVFLFYCRGYMRALLKEIGKPAPFEPSSGGSVATAAFVVMRMLGQKNIILIGQDLAYCDGFTHAGGENDDEEGMIRSIVEGIDGKDVVTRNDWKNYLEWYERCIKDINEKKENIRIIDATEGGAKIHGTEIKTLRNAINEFRDENGKLPSYDFKKELNKLEYYLNDSEYEELLDKHRNSIQKLKEIEIKSEEAIRICKKLIVGIENGTVSATFIDKEKKKIDKINMTISKTLIFPLLNEYLITDVVDEITRLRLAEGDIKTTEINGIKLMQVSFEAIRDASKKMYNKSKFYSI